MYALGAPANQAGRIVLYPFLQEGLLTPFAPSLPSTFGSLFSVCSLLGLVPVEEHLESKDLSQLLRSALGRLVYSLGVPSLPLNDQLVSRKLRPSSSPWPFPPQTC